MSSFTSPLLQVGEDRKDGWMSSFAVVFCYKWVKIEEMDGCLVLLVLCYQWVTIGRMDGCLVLL